MFAPKRWKFLPTFLLFIKMLRTFCFRVISMLILQFCWSFYDPCSFNQRLLTILQSGYFLIFMYLSIQVTVLTFHHVLVNTSCTCQYKLSFLSFNHVLVKTSNCSIIPSCSCQYKLLHSCISKKKSSPFPVLCSVSAIVPTATVPELQWRSSKSGCQWPWSRSLFHQTIFGPAQDFSIRNLSF